MSKAARLHPRRGNRRRAVLAVASLLVVATVLVGGWAWRTASANRGAADTAARRRSATRQQARTLESRHASTVRTVAALRSDLERRTADRDALAGSLVALEGQLSEARANLEREASGLESLDARVGTLQTCLGGMEGALNALAIGDTNTALTRLRAVGPACDASR